jgi:RNA polymerase sigma-70 factor (ECF subfamily)
MIAIEQIWKDFHHNLSGFVTASVPDKSEAQDIVQNIFLKLAQKPVHMDNDTNLRPYLFKVAKNAIIDHYRSSNKKLSTASSGVWETNQIESEYHLADCCLRPMIESLPDIYSQALILSDIEGIPQKELAKRLNLSYSGTKSRVQRAREMLRKAILDCCNYQFDKYGNITGCLPKPVGCCQSNN